jgi:catalase (peroxidase I)
MMLELHSSVCMNDEETVALAQEGHTVGKNTSHGNGDASH